MVSSLKQLEHAKQMSKNNIHYRRFYNSIKTHATRRSYVYGLERFMKFLFTTKKISDVDNFTLLTDFDSDKITDVLEEYVFKLNQTLKPKSINAFLAPVELFFEMNRKIWHKKLVRKSIQKNDSEQFGNTPVTIDEIQNILEVCKHPRDIALVHFLASTGIRPSGLLDPILRLKHLVYLPDPDNLSDTKYCYGLKIYEGSNESYWVFLTPEATNALNRYFGWRKHIRNEILDDSSPIFGSVSLMSKYNHMTLHAMYTVLKKVYDKSGLKREKKGHRYNKAMVYMFRKRFNTTLKLNNNVNSNIAEKLMAHKHGLDGTYLQPTREQCYAEFVKAISELTIDPTERQKLELLKKQEKINELEEQQKENKILNDKVSYLQSKMQSYEDQLDMPVISKKDLPDALKKLSQTNPELFLLQT
jgi:integrase